ncbi:amidohydrolase [Sinomonas atrocyanea]|uniref:Amidohydrolase n=1 Tax=Sinomonas atrocyanea TaxID=37927 RepID=A0A127A469_9MICC|nr:amidohydrolase [Sinomonas atrocyanea]AMM34219.1 amidohydrolase [Sinomonas atrocyanea]GEB66267.1 peptidase [Sinomonas atrocyanea]GGG79298.1 peptidase [Sinomonas atrocyanea]
MAPTGSARTILSGQDSLRDWQESLYKDFHRNPELSHQEVRTAGVVADQLGEFGFEVHPGIGGTGVVGLLSNGDGPTVLLRADMDALPVREATGLDYASTVTAVDDAGSQTPVMHACGHDVHISTLLGAARLFAEQREAWAGTLIALFQPAEELGDGARGMVDAGLAGLIPTPDVALAQHVLVHPAGTVGPHAGPFLSMADSVRITLYGRGSHGSMPHLSIDPAVLASMVVVRLQGVVAREVQPGEFAVLTVGRIAVGAKSNIIDDHAVLELNIRTYSRPIRDQLLAAIERIATAESAASGSPKEPEFEVYNSYPLTDNSAEATAQVAGAFEDYFPAGAIQDFGRQTASEDFSDVPTALGVPYTYWGVGGTDPEVYAAAEAAGTVSALPANHSPMFAPVLQPTLTTGTAALVVAASAWLGRG